MSFPYNASNNSYKVMKKAAPGIISTLFISILFIGGGSFIKSCSNSTSKMESNQWFDEGLWLNGISLKAHSSTNKEEFEKLYKANPVLWKKAFRWLEDTDLEWIDPGTYVIEEGSCKAIVSVAPAPELEATKWEAHKLFSDIQYIVSGKTLMGIAPVSGAKLSEPYNPENDVAFYTTEGDYHTADPESFFIFTPEDAHRPGIKIEGYDEVKKVVIKVRAKEAQ